MLPIYATALAVGGTLLVASLVLGHHGADHDFGGHDVGHAGGEHGSPELGLLASFLSVRFWTFAFAFFGLTGVIFERVVPLSSGTQVLLAAVVAGLVVGFVASTVVNKLRADTVTSTPTELGYVGLEGEVLLDVTTAEPGRIRISARGSLIDLPARTDGPSFLKGAKALVVDVADGVARISLRGGPSSTAAPAPPPPAAPKS